MVVEKLDKPKATSPYEIAQAPKTGDDRGRRQQKDQGEKDEFSASSGIQGWQKFHSSAANRKALKLRRQDIERLWFRQATLQKGIMIVELDVGLRNGQVLRSAQTFITRLDDYWKLRSFAPGQEIPVPEIVREPTIEISIMHRGNSPDTDRAATDKSAGSANKPAPFWSLVDESGSGLNTKAVIFYALLALILLIAIFILL